ncbi:MAG TPA: molybdopterin cofactor-binding domain-containing protein [Candidatus Krumholzibacteria bacterium]|nr:molybdopterin cofactor-binding domain-containing protein [Candidatus Krumholzibacteria bacterium]
MTTITKPPASATEHESVGRSLPKVDGEKLVRGRAVYTDDVHPDGLVIGRILGSPHPHARLRHIDTREALALPGVLCVLTHADVPRVPHTTAGQSHPEPSPYDAYLLDRKVRYVGDRVALVAAVDDDTADEALRRIRVDYEILPAVFEPADALAPGAPVLHDETESTGIADRSRNLAAVLDFEVGDVDAGLARADLVHRDVYRVQAVQHVSLEPHVVITWLDEDDRLLVRTSTQVPFHVRRLLARTLQFPLGRIRVMKPRIGGGFGGKQEMTLEDACAALTLATRQPVKIEYDRSEEFVMSRTRHAMQLEVAIGAKRDGEITAIDMRVLSDTGAYGTHGITVTGSTGSKTLPLYNRAARRFHCDVVYTNHPIAGACRGYGAPQGFFALESAIDELACQLGLDPLELRRRNMIRDGEVDLVSAALEAKGKGWTRRIQSYGLEACIEQGARASGWEKRDALPRDGELVRGMGVALAMQSSGVAGVDWGAAAIKLNEDGSWNLSMGATDLGTGADTALAQIAAETLGVSLDRILVYAADTDLVPYDVGAYASSITYVSGNAVRRAAEEARDQVLGVASRLLGISAERLRCSGNRVESDSGRSLSLAEIADHAMHREMTQILGRASFCIRDSPPPFAAQFAEVEVDTETGRVRVLRFVSAVDCGTAINPLQVEGQIEGAVAMGIGYALCEEMLYDESGRMLNPNLVDYKMIHADDMPAVQTLVVESYEPTGPFGAKSVAEVPTNGPAPAIANAIRHATGVRLTQLPMTPDRVLRALGKI